MAMIKELKTIEFNGGSLEICFYKGSFGWSFNHSKYGLSSGLLSGGTPDELLEEAKKRVFTCVAAIMAQK